MLSAWSLSKLIFFIYWKYVKVADRCPYPFIEPMSHYVDHSRMIWTHREPRLYLWSAGMEGIYCHARPKVVSLSTENDPFHFLCSPWLFSGLPEELMELIWFAVPTIAFLTPSYTSCVNVGRQHRLYSGVSLLVRSCRTLGQERATHAASGRVANLS